jgi:hypothetical protein
MSAPRDITGGHAGGNYYESTGNRVIGKAFCAVRVVLLERDRLWQENACVPIVRERKRFAHTAGKGRRIPHQDVIFSRRRNVLSRAKRAL